MGAVYIGGLTLQIGKILLLVEACGLQAERMDDVVDADGGVVKSLLGLLGGRVGTDI